MPSDVGDLDHRIFRIRGQRVLLDSDLAALYGVPTFRFNEAVKRNANRFPIDFRFRLTRAEFAEFKLRSSDSDVTESKMDTINSSQIAMSSQSRRGALYLPWAFTEHGALMAANVLNSRRAIEMSVFVIRAFVRLRETLASHQEFTAKLTELEKKLEGQNAVITDIVATLRTMLASPEPEHGRKIGFNREKG